MNKKVFVPPGGVKKGFVPPVPIKNKNIMKPPGNIFKVQ